MPSPRPRVDSAGSIVIHTFGAYFGLGVAMAHMRKPDRDKVVETDATSDRFSMLGSMVLWILALVENDHGHAVAMAVAKRMVLFLRRSGNQAQFSSSLLLQEKAPPKLRDLSAFVLEHVDQPLPVERIAAGLGMSSRTLSRFCRQHFNESPAELVRRLRMDEARRLLAETSLPLKDISARAGLGDPSTLWRAFMENLGVTPAEYRQRFAARESGRSVIGSLHP